MNPEQLKAIIQKIVQQTAELKDKHTGAKDAPVNYACIFAQSKKEYEELLEVTRGIGNIIKETPSGFLFQIKPLQTNSGSLKLLKIRLHDPSRPERGDADFTIANYPEFKKFYLSKEGFKVIKREKFEMIELMDPKFNVRAYFSNPPLDQQLGI